VTEGSVFYQLTNIR